MSYDLLLIGLGAVGVSVVEAAGFVEGVTGVHA
jgi:hypothetical protein